MAVLYTPHFIQFFDDNGDPLAAGKLYTYAAGTTTPKATYTAADGLTANANPVVLDSAGRAVVFLDGSYKFRLETAASVLVREVDNVSAFTTSAVTIDSILPTQTGNAGKFLTTNGTAASWGAGSSGLVPIATTTVSSPVTSVDFVHGTGGVIFDGTYKLYAVEILSLVPSTDAVRLMMRTSANSGVSYDSGAADYKWNGTVVTSSVSLGSVGNSSAQLEIGGASLSCGNASNENCYARIIIQDPSASTLYKNITMYSGIVSAATAEPQSSQIIGHRQATTAINGIRFLMSSGNIASGTFKLYGMA